MYKCCSLLLLLLLIGSCSKDDPAPVTQADTEIRSYIDSLGISAVRDESGIYYYAIDSNPGGVPVSPGTVVSFYYRLSDLNGGTLASVQRSDGDSLLAKQGASAIYPVGLDIGLSFMRSGETFGIILPPSLGYEQLTSGAIDPDLVTLLEVEVVGVVSEAEVFNQELTEMSDYVSDQNLNDLVANPVDPVEFTTSGVAYKRKREGSGLSPINGDSIVLNYDASFISGGSFDSRSDFTFVWGADIPRPFIPGLEFGVSRMLTGENALIIIPSSQGYRESAQVIPASIIGDLIDDSIIPDYVSTIPPYRTLIFDVTRVD
ncbi:MAG: FKBP-type peptidyl-prolyl cis-trans isomerase [Bacteroidota bacterium]